MHVFSSKYKLNLLQWLQFIVTFHLRARVSSFAPGRNYTISGKMHCVFCIIIMLHYKYYIQQEAFSSNKRTTYNATIWIYIIAFRIQALSLVESHIYHAEDRHTEVHIRHNQGANSIPLFVWIMYA